MLLLKNFFLLLSFLVLHIALAVDIAVQRDTSTARKLGGDGTSYVWTGTAEFGKKVTDGQLVTICEDAFKSMAASMREHMPDIGNKKIPGVMVAMVYEADPGNKWKVYLASSAKGTKNIVYAAKTSTRDQADCAVTNDFLPKQFRDELENCRADWSNNGDNPRHRNDASCGEQNTLLMIFAEQGKMPEITKETSSIVAIAGRIKDKMEKDEEGNEVVLKKQYIGGKVIPPCTEDGGYGCDEVLKKYFGENINVITEAQEKEPYTDNQAVNVGFQPIFDVQDSDSSSEESDS